MKMKIGKKRVMIAILGIGMFGLIVASSIVDTPPTQLHS